MSNYEQDIMLSELTKGSEAGSIYKTALQRMEAPLLAQAIETCRYNQVKAAKLLGISRGSLRYKLKEYFGDKYVGSK